MALLSKSSAATPPAPAEMFQAIARKTHGIREDTKALVRREIELVKAGVVETDLSPPSEHDDMVAEIINGFAPPAKAKIGHLGEELRLVRRRIRANEAAEQILQSQEVQARSAALAQVMSERQEDWLSIVRERAAAVIALRKANRKAQEFRKAVTKAGGMVPSLVCDRTGGQVFANGVSDPGYEFLQECVRRKILSEKEIANAL